MRSFKSNIERIINHPLFYPAVLLLVGLAAYGILLSRSGFYWDDWESVYLYALHKPEIILQYFNERPLSSLIYIFLFPITKMTPMLWLIIAFTLHWGGVLGIYYALDKVWPERIYQNRWIGILLFVFPAFLQQPVALCYSRHFTSFALFGFSLLFTVLAIKDQKHFWLWVSFSVLFGLAQVFIIEYFVGLEILRPLITWFALRPQNYEEKKSALRKTLLLWAPFVIGLAIYFGWRFFYLPFLIGGGDPNNPQLLKALFQSPINSTLKFTALIFRDLWYMLFAVWAGGFSADKLSFLHSKIAIISWSSGIIAAILAGLYIKRTCREENNSRNNSFLQILFFGLVAFLAGGIPVWATNRQINDGKWSDRFALAPMLGAVIIIVSVIDWLIRTRNQKQAILSLLLVVSIAVQVFNANTFRQDWVLQRSIYWQLAWRIPALKPGTAIIGTGTFTPKSSYYDGVYIVNLLFDKPVKLNPNYDYFDIYHLNPTNFTINQPLTSSPRSGKFVGNTSQAIGVYFDWVGGCVRLLDPVYTGDPSFAENLNNVLPLSNLNQVITSDSPTSPDPAIFGPEPSHDWCYYFEKADLARQLQDWETVIQLDSTAESKSLKPVLGAEYIPFIEAFAQTGDWPKAYELSLSAQEITPEIKTILCNNWNNYAGIVGDQKKTDYLAKASTKFCVNPTH